MTKIEKGFALVVIAGALALGLTACPKANPAIPPPPGATSDVDAKLYDSLMVAQATLESLKADVAKLPPSATPLLNKAISSYNIAETAYQAYHAAVVAGKSGDQDAVTLAIVQATADITAIVQLLVKGN